MVCHAFSPLSSAVHPRASVLKSRGKIYGGVVSGDRFFPLASTTFFSKKTFRDVSKGKLQRAESELGSIKLNDNRTW